jgi:predicted ATPase
MYIEKFQLTNFKRFSDLTIDLGPNEAKLVLLIGKNGSGKSSLLEALHTVKLKLIQEQIRTSQGTNVPYHIRNSPFAVYGNSNSNAGQRYNELLQSINKNGSPYQIQLKLGRGRGYQDIELTIAANKTSKTDPKLTLEETDSLRNRFYGRSSLVAVPKLLPLAPLHKEEIAQDVDISSAYHLADERFNNDVVFWLNYFNEKMTENQEVALALYNTMLADLNKALSNVLDASKSIFVHGISGGLGTNPPYIKISKGTSFFDYEQLSTGEKQVFNILFNLLIRKQHYPDAVFYLDELDQHLEVTIQYRLIKEIVENHIPNGSQLWTASHSLGFLEYANETENALIVDFDDRDYDQTQTLNPEKNIKRDSLKLIVPTKTLVTILAGKKILFVEGLNVEIYEQLALEDLVPASRKDAASIINDSVIHPDVVVGLVDRDWLTDEELEELELHYENIRILRYYAVENYLFHPDNLLESGAIKTEQEAETLKHYLLEKFNARQDKGKSPSNTEVFKLESARKHYTWFKDDAVTPKRGGNDLRRNFLANTENLLPYFNAEDFETFWKVFRVKTWFFSFTETDYPHLVQLNQPEMLIKLASTTWFRQQLLSVLRVKV